MKKMKFLSVMMAAMLTATSLIGCGNDATTAEVQPVTDTAATEEAVSLDSTGSTITKTVKMGAKDVKVEVTDIGKEGTFTFWSAYTGDSAIWEQKRVDAFNEAYADLGIQCELQFVRR